MNRGKQICKALKELRKRIADANGIPFETEECSHEGPCAGTCPKCEQELRQLEAALREKERRGESVYLHGLMADEELRSQVTNVEPMTEDDNMMPTPGIPAAPKEEMMRWKLVRELVAAILECINLVKKYPDVAIYIDPVDFRPIVVKHPDGEADALFGYDYCDWHQLVNNGEVCYSLVMQYVNERIKDTDDDDHTLQGDIATPDGDIEILEGDILPILGHIPKVNSLDNRHLSQILAKRIFGENRNSNVVISPIGVASILTLLRHATYRRSHIWEQINWLLDGFRIEEFDEYEVAGVTLEHGTSMWYDRSLGKIKKTYVAEIRRIFRTEPHAVDFADSSGVKAFVDEWAAEHTNGMIRRIDLPLSPATLMLLVDALYMRAPWDVPFDEADTRHRTFYNADGSTSRVHMMHLCTHEAEYECTDDYQAVNLQYRGCEVFMTIVLPHKDKDLATVMSSCDWLNVDPDDDYDVDLRLPRFRFDYKAELNGTLNALGLGALFDTETAMRRMTDAPAHIDSIFQQCAISVNEQGTEAAAVTVAEVLDGCPPPGEQPKYHRMIVDRPFGFAIQDINGNVIFMGIVNHLDDVAPQQVSTPAREGKYITSITVAGTSHIKDIDTLAADIIEGTELLLKHEPGNSYDRNAIGIYLGDARVGYVPRKHNSILANLLDAGLELFAVVTEAEWRGNWYNIQADIRLSGS